MRFLILPFILLFILFWNCDSIAQPLAPQWKASATVSLETKLISRGVVQSTRDVSPGINLMVEHSNGFFVSAGANEVELAGQVYSPQDSLWQSDYQAGVFRQISPNWSVSLNSAWYLYSQKIADNSWDYQEWQSQLNYNQAISISFAHTDKFWGRDFQRDTAAISGRFRLGNQLISEAEIGTVYLQYHDKNQYQYIRLNIGYLIGTWSAQLQYHNTRNAEDFYESNRVGQQWVFKLARHW